MIWEGAYVQSDKDLNYAAFAYVFHLVVKHRFINDDMRLDEIVNSSLKKFKLNDMREIMTRPKIEFDDNTLQWIIEQRNNKVPVRIIAEKLNVNSQTIARRLKEHYENVYTG